MKITTLTDGIAHKRKPLIDYSKLPNWVKENKNRLQSLYGREVLNCDSFYKTPPCSEKSLKFFIKQRLTKTYPKNISE